MHACDVGHEQCARVLLEAKADPNKANNAGVTALMLSASDGHNLCVRALLENGAAVDATEEDGWTALMFAKQNNHDLCARLLMDWVKETKAKRQRVKSIPSSVLLVC